MEEFKDVILKMDELVEQLCRNDHLRMEFNGMLKRIERLMKLKVETYLSKAVFAVEMETIIKEYDSAIEQLKTGSNQTEEEFNQLFQLEEKRKELLYGNQDFFFTCNLLYPKEEQALIQQCMEPLLTGKFGNGFLFGEPFIVQEETEFGKKRKEINVVLMEQIMSLLTNHTFCAQLKNYLNQQQKLSALEQQLKMIPTIIRLLSELNEKKELLSTMCQLAEEASTLNLNTIRYVVTKDQEQLKHIQKSFFLRVIQKQRINQLKQNLSTMEPQLKELNEKRSQFECEKKKLEQANLDHLFSLALEEDVSISIFPNCMEKTVAEILKQKMNDNNFDFQKEIRMYERKQTKGKQEYRLIQQEIIRIHQNMDPEERQFIESYFEDCKILLNMLHSEDYKQRNPLIAIYILNLICLIQTTEPSILMYFIYTSEELKKLKLQMVEDIHFRFKKPSINFPTKDEKNEKEKNYRIQG